MSTIPERERAPGLSSIELESDPLVERALGFAWEINSDEFTFRIKENCKPVTRRGILSVVASLYDPLGLIAPATLQAKSLLQNLCKDKLGLDDAISEKDASIWRRWMVELPSLSNLKVTRCYKPTGFGKLISTELHTFCDASEFGYGSCCYLRLRDDRGNVHTSLVMGKSRLAPLMRVTIPRLELTAAVTACDCMIWSPVS